MQSVAARTDDVVGAAVALLALTDPAHDPGPLVDALATHCPGRVVRTVWAGDPQLRPCSMVEWVRPASLAGATWERQLVAGPPERAVWIALAAAATELLRDGANSVLALHVGAVAIVGDL